METAALDFFGAAVFVTGGFSCRGIFFLAEDAEGQRARLAKRQPDRRGVRNKFFLRAL
jgi:hypothetical protein